MTEPAYPTFVTGLSYRDPRAALKWLEATFGFEITMVVVDKDENVSHSEMSYGNGKIMVGAEWDEFHASPASLGGKNTQSVHVALSGDLDAHCAHARAAGAVIVREPADQFYGDRVYGASDPEGHIWTFSNTVKTMTVEEMNSGDSGYTVRSHL